MNFDVRVEPNGSETAEAVSAQNKDYGSVPKQSQGIRELRFSLDSLLPNFDLHQTALLL